MSETKTETKFFSKKIRNYCPYCGEKYVFHLELDLKTKGLTTSLIKPHKDCKQFVLFIDPNGAVRGTQCIDTEVSDKEEQELDMKVYVKLFEDQDNISEFYHILEIDSDRLNSKGIITSKKVKYHQLLRSTFYREWIKTFYELKEEFAFIFIDEIFILTINLYDMIIFTLGIHIDRFDASVILKGLPSVIDFVKGKAVSLGEKILS